MYYGRAAPGKADAQLRGIPEKYFRHFAFQI
jgi:hypothetical protein